MLLPPTISRRSMLSGLGFLGALAVAPHKMDAHAAPQDSFADVPDIGSRLEPFVDRFLIDKLDGAEHRLNAPVPVKEVFRFDRPYEGGFSGFGTVIQEGDLCRLYYAAWPAGREPQIGACIAESRDRGHTFTRPNLGLHEFGGNRDNNLYIVGPLGNSFAPFLDTRPGVPDKERYKALVRNGNVLLAFRSADGVRWQPMQDMPVIRDGKFDSLNLAFWSEHEGCYVAYYRITSKGKPPRFQEETGVRSIARATSDDFLNWTPTQPMRFGDTPQEHFYTSSTIPYFRAPHIYLAFPKRYVYERRILSASELMELEVHPMQYQGISDGVFMTSRGGLDFDRTFMEAFVRPGLERGNWAARSMYCNHGMVDTSPTELSLYYQHKYGQPGHCLVRYALRTDGFASVHGGYAGGEMTTKPFLFNGERLVLNAATSAAGSIRVEIQTAAGEPIPGFALSDAMDVIGDGLELDVGWNGDAQLDQLAGRPIRLKFSIKDADLYALQFRTA